jgi:hypothetical protein
MPDFIPIEIGVDIRGKSNPSGIKKDFWYTNEDDISGVPVLLPTANKLSAALIMRAAVAAVAATASTPAIAARPVGAFAKIKGSEVDAKYDCKRLGEGDNHAGFRVTVSVFINGKTPEASYLFGQLRNRPLAVVVEEKDGQKYFIRSITLNHSTQTDPKRGYHLEGTVDVSDEPPVIDSVPQ